MREGQRCRHRLVEDYNIDLFFLTTLWPSSGCQSMWAAYTVLGCLPVYTAGTFCPGNSCLMALSKVNRQCQFLLFDWFFYLQAPKRLKAHWWLFNHLRRLKNFPHSKRTRVLVKLGTVSLCFLGWLTRPVLEIHNLPHKLHAGTFPFWMLIDSNSFFLIACFNCWCLIWLDSNSSTDQRKVALQSGLLEARFSQFSIEIELFFNMSLRQSINLNLGLHRWHLPVEISP